MRAFSLLVALAYGLAATRSIADPWSIEAQSPPVVTVPPGGSGLAVVLPGGAVIFARPAPAENATLRVTNDSDQPATAVLDGSRLTIAVPVGHAVRETSSSGPAPILCRPNDERSNHAECTTEPASYGPSLTFTADRRPAPAPPPTAMRFSGSAFNGYSGRSSLPGSIVTALVDNTTCGVGGVVADGRYSVDVESALTKPGCGTEGAVIRFTIGEPDAASRAAREIGRFRTGATAEMDLTMVIQRVSPPVTPPPPREQSLPVPGVVSVPPGGSVRFTTPATSQPALASLEVVNESEQAATVGHDGTELTITVPARFAARITSTSADIAGACAPAAEQPNMLRCSVQPSDSQPALHFIADRLPAITTDKAAYEPDETIHICYTVPSAGPVTITDIDPSGASQTLLDVYDDGTGWCFDATATFPVGTECLRLDFAGEVSLAAQTCFDVRAPAAVRVEPPGSVAVKPGGTVTFSWFIPCPPVMIGPDGRPFTPSCGGGGPRSLIVVNESDQPAEVSYDRDTLRIAVPAGFTVHIISQSDLENPSSAGAGACGPPPDQPNAWSCRVFATPFMGHRLVFTTDEPSVQHDTVSPGASAAFTLPLRVPVQDATERRVEVVSHATQPLDLGWDGTTLALSAPEGTALHLLSSSVPVPCPTSEAQPSRLTCMVTGLPPTTLTVTTVAFDPGRLARAEVTYAPRWNLVGVPTGMALTEPCVPDPPAPMTVCPPYPAGSRGVISVVYTGDGSGYQRVETYGPESPLEGGTGYWVYFHGRAANTLPPSSPQRVARPLPAGRFVMIGNPGATPATVSGADAVYVYDPALDPTPADPTAPPPPPCSDPEPGCAPAPGYRPASILQPRQGAWAISFAGGEAVISNAEP